MYFLCIDDGGNINQKIDAWKVFGGICFNESDIKELKMGINELKAGVGLSSDDVFKPWKNKYKEKTLTDEEAKFITEGMCDLISELKACWLYGVFFDNKYQKERIKEHNERENYYYKETIDALATRFQFLLNEQGNSFGRYISNSTLGERVFDHYGIIFCDRPGSGINQDELIKIAEISNKGAKYNDLERIFWGVNFVSSRNHFGIELAGLVSFAFKQAINQENFILFDKLKEKIKRTNEGHIDNYGFCFFDGKNRKNTKTRMDRFDILDANEKFKNNVYTEKIIGKGVYYYEPATTATTNTNQGR